MRYHAPFGSSDPNAPYVDRDTPGAVRGSVPPAAAIEHSQREIVALIEKSGMATSEADLAQVAKAVRSQRLNYVPVAGGTANALVVALDPPLTGRVPGMPLRVRIANSNTGAANLDAGYGALPIVTYRGLAIARGDLPAGADMEVIDVGGAWMLSGIAYSEFRRRLTADATFYIRSDGSDGNLGLINSAAGAFQTLAGAFARVSREYETTGFVVTFQLGMAGTYVGAALASAAGNWELVGSSWANAESYVIESPPGLPYTIYSELSDLRIRRCTLRTVYAGTPTIETGVQVANGGNILLDDVVVSQANNRAGYRDIYVNTRGAVRCLNRVQFGGAGTRFAPVECVNQGLFVASDNPAAPTQFFSSGTMGMTGVWCRVTMGGYANWTSCNLAGAAATGSRYYADTGGGIDTGGGGANFLPGNAGGTAVAATMGWYR
jgi:hypothetical protein